ncbi:MAG TPA: hypothetical protein DDZ40_06995 [Deltaproteobacteria bacterium]|nr:hypothetical protein [Deltaproteobacteria bacterium]
MNIPRIFFKNLVMSIFIAAIVFGVTCPGYPFGVRPTGTKSGDVQLDIPFLLKGWYPSASRITITMFTTPAHERVTNIIYGCDDENTDCRNCDGKYAPMPVIFGNQWNDNPGFELASTNTAFCKKYIGKTIRAPYHTACWYILFRDGEKRAAKGEYFDAKSGNVLLYRVHFGDMQFLHSMGSRDGEPASVTKANIMMWAEFTYKLATEQMPRDVIPEQSDIKGMKEIFAGQGRTAQQIFLRNDGTYHRDFPNVALGSLLHMIQDSFTLSHTERGEPSGGKCPGTDHYSPGKIRTFHSYAHQDKDKHKEADLQHAVDINVTSVPPTAVDVGRALRTYVDSRAPWENVKHYLDCVFDLEDPAAGAGPGKDFQPD